MFILDSEQNCKGGKKKKKEDRDIQNLLLVSSFHVKSSWQPLSIRPTIIKVNVEFVDLD